MYKRQIFSNIAPAMPKPSKGTEFIKFAISQASKDMQEVLIPMADVYKRQPLAIGSKM